MMQTEEEQKAHQGELKQRSPADDIGHERRMMMTNRG